MKLSDMIDEENIIPDLKARDKKGVIEEMAESITRNDPSLDKNALIHVLMEREKLGSTGIGDGVAIPHGKFRGLTHPIISFGRSRTGLDFESMDGEPAYIFFLLVAPENAANVHLKALATIAKILKNSSFRKALMEAATKKDLYNEIIQNDEELE